MAAACLVLSIDEAISASATKSVPHAESGDLYRTVVVRCGTTHSAFSLTF
jgi:hypothetical protein